MRRSGRVPWWPDEGDEPDPRWTLANERTLLAYSRTALALVIGGLAVTGSRSITDVPAWLAAVGIPLTILGAALALASRSRFLESQRAMREGRPMPAPVAANLLPLGIAAIAVAGLVLAVIELVL